MLQPVYLFYSSICSRAVDLTCRFTPPCTCSSFFISLWSPIVRIGSRPYGPSGARRTKLDLSDASIRDFCLQTHTTSTISTLSTRTPSKARFLTNKKSASNAKGLRLEAPILKNMIPLPKPKRGGTPAKSQAVSLNLVCPPPHRVSTFHIC